MQERNECNNQTDNECSWSSQKIKCILYKYSFHAPTDMQEFYVHIYTEKKTNISNNTGQSAPGYPRHFQMYGLCVAFVKENKNSANITLRRGVIWDLAQSARKFFSCALKNFRALMFAINTTTTSCRVCFNLKHTEKPCALGFLCALG